MIFNLFKSKPTLKELIPEGFVDIHSHILPGIDDGAKNIEDSIKLIMQMKELGFEKIIGTPHTYQGLYNNSSQSIKKAYVNLMDNLNKEINIEYASEYLLDNSLIKRAQDKDILCLKDNYVLVEMSYFSEPINLYEIIFELRVNGYIPVIAHPERYIYFHNDLKTFKKLKRAGCLLQLNLLSCVGYYNSKVMEFVDLLLKNNLFDFVGSDVHNINHIKRFESKIKIEQTKKLEDCITNTNNILT